MAVYTHLSHGHIATYLAAFDLGELVDCQGIDGGIENTNYFLSIKSLKTNSLKIKSHPTKNNNLQPNPLAQKYVLTLFEDLTFDELPYFADLTTHFLHNKITVPAPIANQQGEVLTWLAGKPAMLFPCFAGAHLARSEITPSICATLGTQLAHFHKVGQQFTQQRHAHRGSHWWNQLAPRAALCINDNDATMLMQSVGNYADMLTHPLALPTGVIHGDLFHDNVLFLEGQLSAIIDLYNACNDYLLFDIATFVNDWCIKDDGAINDVLYQHFTQAYHAVRPFTNDEHRYWNTFLQTAAMRFWLSRLETFHGLDSHQREAGITVLKDPDTFRNILRQRMQNPLTLPS